MDRVHQQCHHTITLPLAVEWALEMVPQLIITLAHPQAVAMEMGPLQVMIIQ